MERTANYTLVGLFTILATAGLGAFLIWLAGAQFAQRFDVYDIAFHGPVRGLSVGGEVYFNGIRVGEVTRLSLDKDDPDRVSARIRITAETPVRIVSRASLEPQGVTGASYVQISAGDRKSPFLRGTVPEGQIPVIQASRSPFETLLAGGGDVLTRTVEVLDRVNRLISDDNVAEVSASIRDVHGLTSELRASGGVIASVRTASASITATSDKFGALADQSNRLISGDGRTSLAAIAGAATEMQDTAREVHGLVRRLDAPLSSFAIDGLPQITHTLVSVETTSDSLSRLSASLQASPMGLVAKPPAQTVEIKP